MLRRRNKIKEWNSSPGSIEELIAGLQPLPSEEEKCIWQTSKVQSEIQPLLPFNLNVHPHHPNFLDPTNKQKSKWVDVPCFSGENAFVWVAQIQRYFDLFNTPDSQRLVIASFYLDGNVLDWYD